MDVNGEAVKAMAAQDLCPCCGDRVSCPNPEGKITLCDVDFAVFQSITRFEDGKTLGQKIERLGTEGLRRLKAGEISLFPPKEMVESLTGKTLEQAGTESLHGFCPCCEKPHKHSTRNLQVGPDGINRKVLFCSGCYDVYTRRNKFAKAIALMVLDGKGL